MQDECAVSDGCSVSADIQNRREAPEIEMIENKNRTARNYNRVPSNVRKELIDRVSTNGESIYEVIFSFLEG